MAKPDKPLSADQKLEIREEVERQLTKPPGDALLWVQKEIREGIDVKAKEFWRLNIVVGSLGAIIATVLGINWLTVQSKFEETNKKFDSAQRDLVTRYAEVTSLASTMSRRYEELQKMDNIVTTTQLKKQLEVVETLREQTESALVTALRLAAMEGDANAYDELCALRTNQLQLGNLAVWATLQVETSLTGPFHPTDQDRRVSRTWDYNLGFDEALNQYRSARPEEMISIIETIWTRTNFAKSQRMEFLVMTARTCPTIQGRVVANQLLNTETKNTFSPIDPSRLNGWWETNKAKFVEPRSN